jgi:hypothetical protein
MMNSLETGAAMRMKTSLVILIVEQMCVGPIQWNGMPRVPQEARP